MSKKSIDRNRSLADILLADGKNADRFALVGELHRSKGRLREAEICLRRAVELVDALGDEAGSRSYAYLELGRLLVEAGKPAEGEEWLRRAAEIVEGGNDGIRFNLATHSLVCFELGKALAALDKHTEAATWLAKAEAYVLEVNEISKSQAKRAAATLRSGNDRSDTAKKTARTKWKSTRNTTNPRRFGTRGEEWETIWQAMSSRLKLPLPDTFERNYVAVLARASTPLSNQELFRGLRRRREMQAQIPTFGDFIVKAFHAEQQPFLKTVVCAESKKRLHSKQNARIGLRHAAPGETTMHTLVLQPIELLAAVCRSVVDQRPVTPEIVHDLSLFARILNLPTDLSKSFRTWLARLEKDESQSRRIGEN